MYFVWKLPFLFQNGVYIIEFSYQKGGKIVETVFHIEQNVIDQINELDKECKKQKRRKNALEDNIDNYIYEYITCHGLWNDYAAIATIMRYWPVYIYMPKTEEKIQSIFHEKSKMIRHVRDTELDKPYQLDNQSKRIFKKIQVRYCILEKRVNESTEKMKDYVCSYINNKGWDNNSEALKQVRDILPAGYIRFLVIAWYQDLERNVNK